MPNQANAQQSITRFPIPWLFEGDHEKVSFLNQVKKCESSFICIATNKATLAEVKKLNCDTEYFRPNKVVSGKKETNRLVSSKGKSIDFGKLRREKLSISETR